MNPVTPGDSPAQSDVSLLSSPGSMGSAGASEDAEKPEDRVRIKSKLVSAWNSVKYGTFLDFLRKTLVKSLRNLIDLI